METSEKNPGTERVGIVSSTFNNPTTTDRFAINLDRDQSVHRFDIVTAEIDDESRTHGIIEEVSNITEAPSHLTNHMGTDIGGIDEEPNSKLFEVNNAQVVVLSNSIGRDMPVPNNTRVRLANARDIHEALGIDQRLRDSPENMIPAGMLKQSNGVTVPVLIDRTFLFGPEAAHLNASGVSGLATKTSYLLFVIMAALVHEARQDAKRTAAIILNSKKADLLQMHREEEHLSEEDKQDWRALGMEPQAFTNVQYFLPRSKQGEAYSYFPIPTTHTLYAFPLRESAQYLDMLFGDIDDKSETIASLIGEIGACLESDASGNMFDPAGKEMTTWSRLLAFLERVSAPGQNGRRSDWRSIRAVSIQKFIRQFKRLVTNARSGLFVEQLKETGTHPEKTPVHIIENIRAGDVYVFDIANLRDYERVMVVGSILQSINEIKSDPQKRQVFPECVVIYLDELGKYAPEGEHSATVRQFIEIAERGRSSGEILFCAEQARSKVNNRIIGTIGNSVIGRTGSTELETSSYRAIPPNLKTTIPRLQPGEMVLTHPLFRSTIKIQFPKPAWKQ